ncbi:MAG: hypothetical protein KIS76_14460 [Pyrinomonadaceae bacterium]|nr:hypothetical protein [Pyrinomonadaceae bacterium]
MNTIEIGELQKHLGVYLAQVKQGLEIAVEENDEIIARILPFEANDSLSKDERKLVGEGLMRLPLQEEMGDEFWEANLPEIDLEKVVETIRSERDDD